MVIVAPIVDPFGASISRRYSRLRSCEKTSNEVLFWSGAAGLEQWFPQVFGTAFRDGNSGESQPIATSIYEPYARLGGGSIQHSWCNGGNQDFAVEGGGKERRNFGSQNPTHGRRATHADGGHIPLTSPLGNCRFRSSTSRTAPEIARLSPCGVITWKDAAARGASARD